MKISIILAHPNEGSFNHAIARTAEQQLKASGHDLIFHDLYREKFDPILATEEIPTDVLLPEDIANHCREIAEAEGIIIIHPNWWGQPPAILKGWVDRVFRPNVAYEFLEGDSGEGVPIGLIKAKVAMVFNTSNTENQREMNVFGDPLERIWKNCVFGLCGTADFYRQTFSVVVTSTVIQRKQWLDEVRKSIDTYFPGKNESKSA
jgi:NAD(P)H dehydrogenase (quinone)